MTIITPGLTSLLVGDMGSSQNRGVTLAPAASLENLDDMASSGQISTDFLGAGVQTKLSGRRDRSWKIGGWSSKSSRGQGKWCVSMVFLRATKNSSVRLMRWCVCHRPLASGTMEMRCVFRDIATPPSDAGLERQFSWKFEVL